MEVGEGEEQMYGAVRCTVRSYESHVLVTDRVISVAKLRSTSANANNGSMF